MLIILYDLTWKEKKAKYIVSVTVEDFRYKVVGLRLLGVIVGLVKVDESVLGW